MPRVARREPSTARCPLSRWRGTASRCAVLAESGTAASDFVADLPDGMLLSGSDHQMKEAPANPRQDHTRPWPGGSDWQRTLWAIVCIQFVMRAGVNFLSPITRCRNWVSDQRKASIFGRASAQVPCLSTPPLPRRSGAAVHWADGVVHQCPAILRRKSGHRGLRGVFLCRDCAGSQPGAGTSAGPPIGLAGIRPARRVTDRPILAGPLADVTGSYRVPFFWCAGIPCAGRALV